MKTAVMIKKTKTYKLFVYGTLKLGPRDTHYVDARMWNVGQFPCVKLFRTPTDSEVPGQLMDVTDYDLTRLDRYEGVPNLYTREKTLAYKIGQDGPGEEVYIYEWAKGTEDLRRIASWDDGKAVGL